MTAKQVKHYTNDYNSEKQGSISYSDWNTDNEYDSIDGYVNVTANNVVSIEGTFQCTMEVYDSEMDEYTGETVEITNGSFKVKKPKN